MGAYMVRRIGQALLVIVGVTILVFGLEHLLPGGPARAVLGLKATPTAIKTFEQQYGLTQPVPMQYLAWLGQLLRGNLGYSYKLGESVDTLIAQSLPNTVILVGSATLIAVLIGVPLGVLQASRRNRSDDYAFSMATLVLYSTPSFLLGITLIFLFSALVPLFPSYGPNSASPLFTQVPSLILPIATLTLVNLALFSRYARSSTIQALLEDYIRTAASKGVSPASILIRHAARNALLPVITLIGLSLPWMVGGAVVIESVFNYPGMGLLFWKAATSEDFPVMLGVSVVVGIAVVMGSLVADLLYAVADPRVRYR